MGRVLAALAVCLCVGVVLAEGVSQQVLLEVLRADAAAVQGAVARIGLSAAQEQQIRAQLGKGCVANKVTVPVILPALPACGYGCNPESMISPSELKARRQEEQEQRERMIQLFQRECLHRTIETNKEKLMAIEQLADQIRSHFLDVEAQKQSVLRLLHTDKEAIRATQTQERKELNNVQTQMMSELKQERKREIAAERNAKKAKRESWQKNVKHVNVMNVAIRQREAAAKKTLKEHNAKRREAEIKTIRAKKQILKHELAEQKRARVAAEEQAKFLLKKESEERTKATVRRIGSKAMKADKKALSAAKKIEKLEQQASKIGSKKSGSQSGKKGSVNSNAQMPSSGRKSGPSATDGAPGVMRADGGTDRLPGPVQKAKEMPTPQSTLKKGPPAKKSGEYDPLIVSKLMKPNGRTIARAASPADSITADTPGFPDADKPSGGANAGGVDGLFVLKLGKDGTPKLKKAPKPKKAANKRRRKAARKPRKKGKKAGKPKPKPKPNAKLSAKKKLTKRVNKMVKRAAKAAAKATGKKAAAKAAAKKDDGDDDDDDDKARFRAVPVSRQEPIIVDKLDLHDDS